MEERITYVGLDVHKDSITAAVLPSGQAEALPPVRMSSDPGKVRRFFAPLVSAGPVYACYEAGSCGFVLYRRLTDWGVRCAVVAPSLIPKRPGDRRKTDGRDATQLGTLLRGGQLTVVRVPTEAEERVRGVVRCRDQLRREVMTSRHYVLKFLTLRDHVYRTGKAWKPAHWAWMRDLALEPEDRLVLDTHLALLEVKLAERARIDEEIEKLALREPYRDGVARLRCLRGIDTLSAMTIACEVGDVRRFSSPRRLMGYFGLIVSEFSSGPREQRGGITKTGNPWVRRILVEAAWHYRHPPRISQDLGRRQKGASPSVIAHAWRAQLRLHRKFLKLSPRMPLAKAATAVARELTGFVWALLWGEPQALAAQP